MQLIYYPNNLLLEKCHPVKEVDYRGSNIDAEKYLYYYDTSFKKKIIEDRVRLATKMWKIMRKNRGAGLAAPQVGLNIRMFVWKHNEEHAIWNPTISCLSGSSESVEGCLSLPKVAVKMQRETSSVLTGTDINGKPLRLIGDINTTRIWLHEIDHLDGKLIIDNMSHEDNINNRDALRTLLKGTVV